MTNSDPALDGITVVDFKVADSLKHSMQASPGSVAISSARSANEMTGVPTAALLVSPANMSSASVASYTVASVAFTPEPAPTKFLASCDDCVAYDTPLGFDFTFFGNTYNKVHVGANGFVGFDRSIAGGCCAGGVIPSPGDAPYNNMIAIAWTDLNSAASKEGIRYETQGIAPNRKFVLQFNDVPEYWQGPGRVTAQLVLAEGSNDITIYTFSNTIVTNPYHTVTQGIENADGSEAEFVNGRVRSYFALTNDAVRFALPRPAVVPVIVAPADILVATMIAANSRLASSTSSVGTCSAVVNPGVATINGDTTGVTIAGARSDGLLLNAAYPKGSTTITWTATNAAGLSSAASQKVTVEDKENPSVSAPANISTRVAHGASSATVIVGDASAADNCPDVKVAGARSDGADLSALYPVGITTVKWTATDASGNTASADQQITVTVNTPPVIAAPAMLVFNTDPGVCAALASVGTPVVTDDIPGSTILSQRSDGLSLSAAYPKGVTSITWTATDADGATSSATQTITVNDGEKPSINKPADVSSGTDHGLASAVLAIGTPSAADNCHDVTVNGARSDGASLDAPYNMGVTTINWTARDAAGNAAAVAQAITVLDLEAPTITVPADMRVDATSPSGAVAIYTPLFNDNVRVTDASCMPESGSLFPIGPRTVKCTASDAAGNTASKSFTVTVVGAEQQLGDLIAYVLSRNLPNGTTNPLVEQLRAAFRADNNRVSCTKMSDFIDMVGTKGGSITDDESVYMIRRATTIMGAMGCGSDPMAPAQSSRTR
ncbi:MAG TPA: HYR domain-containing protein [Gemmatimonadaceae bacterium]